MTLDGFLFVVLNTVLGLIEFIVVNLGLDIFR